jgi:deoxycytidylate deaminase
MYSTDDGIIQKLKGRHRRYIEASARAAEDSEFPNYRHGAVLVRGGSILSTAFNKSNHINWANKFRNKDCGHATHHAEVGTILGMAREKTMGATLYVARIGKSGELKMSKPCEMCQQVLAHVGVKKVYYSIDNDNIGYIKL